ncbi:putative quinol monooxygenase [Gloeobacter morelensis]|uniref:Antibiotic biosynthesis monooxygenase n=1 Tax=Gloeobacter morelensis MG652769 TaxID=2781736 RepID=A0ABY3PJ44_9CYAN|nr:antibiotic biosynthesis monooxygenase family protein [Gloeobacter morelensis]UFP93680.1 antibiotic biosynthesis monooxygenase [Gloeobacter morelensis MG652769]
MRTECFWLRRQLTSMGLLGQLAAIIAICLAMAAAGSPAVAQEKAQATSPNGETALLVEFDVKPGSEAEFEQALAILTRCAKLDPGAIVFNAHKVRDQAGRYTLYEIWRSPEALMSHWRRPYVKNLLKTAERTLAKPIANGGIVRRFISEIEPAKRSAPVTGDPSSVTECR